MSDDLKMVVKTRHIDHRDSSRRPRVVSLRPSTGPKKGASGPERTSGGAERSDPDILGGKVGSPRFIQKVVIETKGRRLECNIES